MLRYILAKIALLGFAFHMPLHAQPMVGRPGDVDRRASVAITIPLGGKASAETKPRMELLISQDRMPANEYHYNFERAYRPKQSRIGFTLNRQPNLMINGHMVKPQDNKARMGTVGYVLIGVALVAGIGVLALNEALDDASD